MIPLASSQLLVQKLTTGQQRRVAFAMYMRYVTEYKCKCMCVSIEAKKLFELRNKFERASAWAGCKRPPLASSFRLLALSIWRYNHSSPLYRSFVASSGSLLLYRLVACCLSTRLNSNRHRPAYSSFPAIELSEPQARDATSIVSYESHSPAASLNHLALNLEVRRRLRDFLSLSLSLSLWNLHCMDDSGG